MARTTQQVINIANSSCVYASNELSGGKFHSSSLDKRLPSLIYAVRQGLEWLYELDPAHEDILPISNYLISICKFSDKAEANMGSGGALPIVLGTASPSALDWIISASSTPLATGETSVTLTQFIGYDINFIRGSLTQYTTNPGDGSTYYSWNKTSGLFTISSAASLGEQMRIFI